MPAMTAAQTLNEESSAQNVEGSTQFTRRIVQRSGSSFYWAMRVLDADRRAALYAIYAFCRAVDDIVDGPDDGPDAPGSPGGRAEKLRALDHWRSEISRVFEGRAETPTGRSLQDVVVRYSLEREDFLSVIKGMETDAGECVRLEDAAALSEYIDRVACAVGRLCTPVFGLGREQGRSLARALGEALQLTNILRDLEEDAARDRLYLPQDMLEAAGISDKPASEVVTESACAGVCEDLAARAQGRFREAGALLAGMDTRAARAPRLMMAAYEKLLQKIIRAGWKPPRRRASLNWVEKLWIVVRHGRA